MERILGVHIPPPPSGVEAVEPDTREPPPSASNSELHRGARILQFPPPNSILLGSLESFDIAGGRQDHYRANGDIGKPAEGLGKNGHAFAFRYAEPVDPSGEMQDGTPFQNINEFKRILLEDERAIARNFAKH